MSAEVKPAWRFDAGARRRASVREEVRWSRLVLDARRRVARWLEVQWRLAPWRLEMQRQVLQRQGDATGRLEIYGDRSGGTLMGQQRHGKADLEWQGKVRRSHGGSGARWNLCRRRDGQLRGDAANTWRREQQAGGSSPSRHEMEMAEIGRAHV